ncbi:MAG: ferredoxin, partial [Vallitaleaceae bacterium]|nr:ferredoxin [Vallitaleaceae bacterium]
MMRKYENHVQMIKSQVYQKVSEYSFEGKLLEKIHKIPEELNKGPNPSLRCCVYHERAVTAERVQMTMGGEKSNPNLVEVLYAACDQCTENRYVVNESCRGCIAHRCQQSCPVNAISFINNKAIIDYSKCI